MSTFASAAEVTDEMRILTADWQVLDDDITHAVKNRGFLTAQTRPFVGSWTRFTDEMRQFFRQIQALPQGSDPTLSTTFDRLVEYRRRVGAFREQFKRLGGRVSAPPPAPPAETWAERLERLAKKAGDTLTNMVVIGGLAFVAVAVLNRRR